MFLPKLIITLFVLGVSGSDFERHCRDCMVYTSCSSAKERVAKYQNQDTLNLFERANCGYEDTRPKVCCSDFRVSAPSFQNRAASTEDYYNKEIIYEEGDEDAQETTEEPVIRSQYHIENITSTDNSEMSPEMTNKLRLLTNYNCGQILGRRIVGGTRAELYEFPWMALISYKTVDDLDFSCGGSIISSRYILTAAHCITPHILGVRVGEYIINDDAPDCNFDGSICSPPYIDLGVEYSSIIVHEHYNPDDKSNDIALIPLLEDIDFTQDNLAPVCLPITERLRSKDLSGKEVTVAGWGVTETGKKSGYLLKVNLKVQPEDTCRKYHSTMICAGSGDGRDSCGADSGGPLMFSSEYYGSTRFVQFGLVSYGQVRCGSDVGYYTDVRQYIDWILRNIRE
ncbi:unnamed protein product [Leptosia nina]|uniref:Peptidase S1 domain-containing protein n=1 Tax=Leptosia nina TaxID=320188 RepID=A0AAV1JSB2_9NEOP